MIISVKGWFLRCISTDRQTGDYLLLYDYVYENILLQLYELMKLSNVLTGDAFITVVSICTFD